MAIFCLLGSYCTFAQTDPYAGLAKFSFGQSREPLARIEEQIRKTAPSEYKAIEARLLPILKDAQTPKDAKRYICRWLAVVGSADCVPAVAELLTDPDLSHPARMALEPLAVPEASAALRAALPKLQGKLLVGVIGSIGVRRDAQAVAPLTKYVNDADELVAGTAIAALGAIGTEAAAKVLDGAKVPDSLARTLARARITAASHLTEAGKNAVAVGIFRSLMTPAQPQAIRIAALKGQIGALPQAQAAKLILDMVQGDDDAMRAATIAAYTSSRDQALKDRVAGELPTLKPAGQLILLGVLPDQPEVAARAGVLQTLSAASDDKVRVAALECLARHGEAADVPLMVGLASGSGPAADAAKKTLQRLGKPGVDDALVKLIESPKPAERAVVLGVLANRRVESALPTLVRLANGADAALAVEAAKALGVMGRSEQLKDLAGVIVRTGSAELRNASEEAAKAICRRAADKPAQAAPLLAALPQATAAPARIALLQILAFTGGQPALDAVVAAMKDANSEVKTAATRVLISWPEAAAGAPLLELAKSTPDASQAIVALRDGCLRLAEMDELPMTERVNILRGVIDVAKRPEEKKRALMIAGDIASPASLELLLAASKDAALQTDATKGAIRLARQLGAVYPKPALAALEQIKAQAATDEIKQQVDQAIKAVQNAGQSPDGFILAWLMAGPLTREGKDGAALFDEVFPPEQAGGKADWKPVTASKSGIVEFDRILRGGDNRVAYLKTQIVSDKEQEALLEMGSDDGIKVWLNGKVVHANNSVRPCTPGSDKKKIKLNQGANSLLLKITQSAGQWAACCRLRAADGKEIQDVMVAPGAE